MLEQYGGHKKNAHPTRTEFILPEGQKLLREIRGTYTALPIDLSVTSGIADVEYETRVVLRDTLAIPGTASLPQHLPIRAAVVRFRSQRSGDLHMWFAGRW